MNWKQAKKQLLANPETYQAYQKIDLSFEVGRMITDARIQRNITQKKLAELVGTKQPSIARIENGNYLPSLSFLQRIAKALGTQLVAPRFEFLEPAERQTVNVTFKVQIISPTHYLNYGNWTHELIPSAEMLGFNQSKEYKSPITEGVINAYC